MLDGTSEGVSQGVITDNYGKGNLVRIQIPVSESETSVIRSRRITDGTRMEALDDVDIGTVDVEPLQFHCSSNVVVPGDMVGDSMTVGTVLYCGSGTTYRYSSRAARNKQMVTTFGGFRFVLTLY